jgi:lipopolysaccharide O-acetyltransferase
LSAVDAQRVRDAVLDRVEPALRDRGLARSEVPDDFDLLAEGVVDSFGLLELIGSLEESLGVTLDFETVDPDELTVLGTFTRHVEAQARAQADGGEGDIGAAAGPEQQTLGDLRQPEGAVTAPSSPVDRRAGRVRRTLGRSALQLHRLWVRSRDKAFSMTVAGGFHSFGRNSVIQVPARIKNAHRIAVGERVFVASGSWLHVLDDDGDVALEIGDGASIADGCVFSAARSIRLGTKVSLARYVYIADHAHAYDDPDTPSLEQGITDIRPVEIGDGAWLGQNVTVLPGVRIGKGCVVAAHSVVSTDVPDYSLVAGAPGRVIRRFGPKAS